MTESHVAKSGDLIFDFERRQLCSHHDPRKEAMDWSERRISEGIYARHIIILGLGCGYHVEALYKKLPITPDRKIYVIETNKEIMDACAKIHSLDFAKFNARYMPDVSTLKESVWFQEAIGSSFQVLVHKPSYFANRDRYAPIYQMMMARNWGALTWMWEQRTRSSLIQQLQPILSTENNGLTLKDLDGLIEKSSLRGKSKSWMIFRALRELVL